jgi:hypothetical protein
MTQAGTQKASLVALREAVELWFEPCIERVDLDEALQEVGFTKTDGVISGEHADFVQVFRRKAAQSIPTKPLFRIGRNKQGQDYIEGLIPAHIAAPHLRRARSPDWSGWRRAGR